MIRHAVNYIIPNLFLKRNVCREKAIDCITLAYSSVQNKTNNVKIYHKGI